MAKIKANRLSNTTHKTTAKLTFTGDDGAAATDDFTIIFRGMSPRVAREVSESVLGDGDRVEMAKYLAKTVVSLPEVIGEDDQPVEITFEFLDAMETPNLKAMFDAVVEGYSPNAEPSGALPDTSAPEGEKASQ